MQVQPSGSGTVCAALLPSNSSCAIVIGLYVDAPGLGVAIFTSTIQVLGLDTNTVRTRRQSKRAEQYPKKGHAPVGRVSSTRPAASPPAESAAAVGAIVAPPALPASVRTETEPPSADDTSVRMTARRTEVRPSACTTVAAPLPRWRIVGGERSCTVGGVILSEGGRLTQSW